jgi:hypothetical protein
MATVDTAMIHQEPAVLRIAGCKASAARGNTSAARPRVTRLAAPNPGPGRQPGRRHRVSPTRSMYMMTACRR